MELQVCVCVCVCVCVWYERNAIRTTRTPCILVIYMK